MKKRFGGFFKDIFRFSTENEESNFQFWFYEEELLAHEFLNTIKEYRVEQIDSKKEVV